jgi:anti-sigma regulatory factor (Ser/Thr protein kinase)
MFVSAREQASPPDGDFAHRALIYDSVEGFVDVALPFVREGIEAGEPMLVRIRRDNVGALTKALGDDVRAADIASAEDFYETPARTRGKVLDWVRRNDGHGRRVRVLGEPPWPLGFEAGVREWERHEAVVNVVFWSFDACFGCLYDRRSLPPDVVDSAAATHPAVTRPDGTSESSAYSRPEMFCERLNAQTPTRTGHPAIQMPFDLGNLDAVRALVENEGAASGLRGNRLLDHTIAVDEVATNAVQHGASPARLKLWREPGEIVWEVSDTGAGIRDPLAGQIAPDPAALQGRGLWMARMISDALEFRTDQDGTVVALHFTLPAN